MSDQFLIAARLKTARKIAGYKTSKDFCAKFDIPESTYSQHERANRKIKEDVLKTYADFLNIDFHWLNTGSGNPFNSKILNDQNADKVEKELAIAKSRFENVSIDKTLHKNILESFFSLQKKYELEIDPKIASSIIIEIYHDVSHASNDPELRKKLIDSMLKPYIILLQKNT